MLIRANYIVSGIKFDVVVCNQNLWVIAHSKVPIQFRSVV